MGPKQAINSLSPPVLLYEELQPANINSWEGHTHPISLFRRLGTQDIDVNNIKVSLERMSDFISNHHLKNHKEDEISCLTSFGKVTFELISSIFKGGWDNLLVRDRQKMFRDKIKEEFTTSVSIASSNRKSTRLPPAKPAEFSNISPPLNPVSSSKGESSAKNKGKKPSNNNFFNKPSGPMCSYAQVLLISNVQEILKLKENFPKLLDKKIKQIHKTVNNSNAPSKPCINMTTKDPLRKQIIIPMGSDNSKKFLSTSGDHVTNINRALKGIKSNVIINFIKSDYRGLIVVSNKVAAPSDISVINKYIKNSNIQTILMLMTFKTLNSLSPNLISRFWEFHISQRIPTLRSTLMSWKALSKLPISLTISKSLPNPVCVRYSRNPIWQSFGSTSGIRRIACQQRKSLTEALM